MILDMDTELQHLISISVEKMTSGASSSLAGRESRKSGGMDLRKALLVAHFLQEVRQAYLNENYLIVANTFSSYEDADYHETYRSRENHLTKEVNERYEKESHAYFIDIDASALPTSSSVYPSCVTNADVMVSKISQITTPVPVSINTSHVTCHQSSTGVDLLKDESVSIGDDVPVFCDELEVSSCCEVVSSNGDDVTSCAEIESNDHVTSAHRTEEQSGSERVADVGVAADSVPLQSTSQHNTLKENNVDVTLCPLPKKKRPLPIEFLSNKTIPSVKAAKTEEVENRSNISRLIATLPSTSIATTVNSVTRTSPSICSALGDQMTRKTKRHSSPKVIVQMTQSCDSYLPITCSQVYLKQRLGNLTARAY